MYTVDSLLWLSSSSFYKHDDDDDDDDVDDDHDNDDDDDTLQFLSLVIPALCGNDPDCSAA